MNKLIASLFLVVFVAVGESQEDSRDKFMPNVRKYCNGKFGPNGDAFRACYKKQVEAYPSVYDSSSLINDCAKGRTVSATLIKRECDVINGPTSPARDTIMQCLVDHVKKNLEGSGLTFDEAIAIGAKRVDACLTAS